MDWIGSDWTGLDWTGGWTDGWTSEVCGVWSCVGKHRYYSPAGCGNIFWYLGLVEFTTMIVLSTICLTLYVLLLLLSQCLQRESCLVVVLVSLTGCRW